jgi:flavin-dependent dehydrogenase
MGPAMTITATLTPAQAVRRSWQIVVVGAGPAGALAARELARRGRAVLLVDRAAFPRSKVCGCCLNAAALATLAGVGLADLTARHGAVPLREIVLAARRRQARLQLPGGVVLSRAAFDAALVAEAIAAGADFLPGTRAALGPVVGEQRRVTLAANGATATTGASLVLAADGLGGQLLSGSPTPGSRIGAGTTTDDVPDYFRPGCVYMACGSGGYVGLARLEDGRLDVAAAFDREMTRRAGGPGEAAASILRDVAWPAVPALAKLPWRGTPGLTRPAARLWAERVLALGDAAGYVEPFTGEGIAWALASAVAVASVAAAGWDAATGRAWAATYRRIVIGRQGTCRAVAWALRQARLVGVMVGVLERWPKLANPVINRLNAPLPAAYDLALAPSWSSER